jgi:hypothetical protein
MAHFTCSLSTDIILLLAPFNGWSWRTTAVNVLVKRAVHHLDGFNLSATREFHLLYRIMQFCVYTSFELSKLLPVPKVQIA